MVRLGVYCRTVSDNFVFFDYGVKSGVNEKVFLEFAGLK
jgi:hypothetical protein